MTINQAKKVENEQNEIIIYTDGASSGNPGPGGWAAVFRIGSEVCEIGGADENTTNNRMEMMAAIEAIKAINKKNAAKNATEIFLYTDSTYLVKGITSWIFNWKRNNWRNNQKDPVLNKDLWIDLEEQVHGLKINWKIVSGHAGVVLNNRVDEIAVSFSQSVKNKDSNKPKLFAGHADTYEFKVDHPTEEELKSKKTAPKKSKSSGKAYSYVSLLDGVIQKHKTWEDCKNRVHKQKKVLYKKTINEADEKELISKWSDLK